MSKTKKRIFLAVLLVFLVLIFGTIFYHFVESWCWIDAFYFTTVTLTTIGYGDLYPTHEVSKILTSIFALASIPIIIFAFSIIAESYFEKRFQHFLSHESKKEIKEIRNLEDEIKEKKE